MKVTLKISREALVTKGTKKATKITIGDPPKKRSTEALSELLHVLKK